jgi:hypothetical protein
MKAQGTLYIPIRCTEGRVWMDFSNASVLREEVDKNIEAARGRIPTWHQSRRADYQKDHP